MESKIKDFKLYKLVGIDLLNFDEEFSLSGKMYVYTFGFGHTIHSEQYYGLNGDQIEGELLKYTLNKTDSMKMLTDWKSKGLI